MAEDSDEYVYGTGVPMVVKPPGAGNFDKLLESIRYKGQLIVIGFLFAAIMVGLPMICSGGI